MIVTANNNYNRYIILLIKTFKKKNNQSTFLNNFIILTFNMTCTLSNKYFFTYNILLLDRYNNTIDLCDII